MGALANTDLHSGVVEPAELVQGDDWQGCSCCQSLEDLPALLLLPNDYVYPSLDNEEDGVIAQKELVGLKPSIIKMYLEFFCFSSFKPSSPQQSLSNIWSQVLELREEALSIPKQDIIDSLGIKEVFITFLSVLLSQYVKVFTRKSSLACWRDRLLQSRCSFI